MDEIFELIAKRMDGMSKTHKKLANYILENKSNVSFLNISNLAKLSGTSEASIVRFCTYLGYKGYPDFKKELQASVEQRLSIRERLAISANVYENKESFVADIFRDDINNINTTLENLDMNTFFSVCEQILKAKRICIIAGRSAVALGSFLEYYLNLILGNVCLISFVESQADGLSFFGPETLVIGITFSRYTKATLEAMAYAHEQGCVCVAITDSFKSPVVPYSQYAFFTETNMWSLLDTYVAPLTLINAILAYISKLKKDNINERLKTFEKSWKYFNIFDE